MSHCSLDILRVKAVATVVSNNPRPKVHSFSERTDVGVEQETNLYSGGEADSILLTPQVGWLGRSMQGLSCSDAFINGQHAACNSVLIDLAKAKRRWTEKKARSLVRRHSRVWHWLTVTRLEQSPGREIHQQAEPLSAELRHPCQKLRHVAR